MKTKNIILGLVLIVTGVGAYFFLTKDKKTNKTAGKTTDDTVSTPSDSTNTDTTTPAVVDGKSKVVDVPMNTPILADTIKQERELLAKQKADAEALLKSVNQKEIDLQNTLTGKTEAQILAEAKALSLLVFENKRKQRGYKKKSSKNNIQTVIDTDIAKLLALGYKPLDNGEVEKL